jgi:hypothetical protein
MWRIIYLRHSERVEESRGVANGVATGSFDSAQDDSAITNVVIRAVTHKIRLQSTLSC